MVLGAGDDKRMAHIQQSEELLTKPDTSQHKEIEQQILAALKQNSSGQKYWELIRETPGKKPLQNLSSGPFYRKMRKNRESLRVIRSRIDLSQGKPGHYLPTAPQAGANMAAGLENRATNSRHTTNLMQKHYLMPIRKSSL
jgi:hypothetical protein